MKDKRSLGPEFWFGLLDGGMVAPFMWREASIGIKMMASEEEELAKEREELAKEVERRQKIRVSWKLRKNKQEGGNSQQCKMLQRSSKEKTKKYPVVFSNNLMARSVTVDWWGQKLYFSDLKNVWKCGSRENEYR